MNKRPETVATYFGSNAAGGIFVPVDPVLKKAQVRHILDDCAVSVMITSVAFFKNTQQELAECKSLRTVVLVDASDGIESAGRFRVLPWSELTADDGTTITGPSRIDNDVASILYTSGSTGKPKSVVLSHRNVVDGATSVSSCEIRIDA